MGDPNYLQFVEDLTTLPANFAMTAWIDYLLTGQVEKKLGHIIDALRSNTDGLTNFQFCFRQCLNLQAFWQRVPIALTSEFVRQLVEIGVNQPNVRELCINGIVNGCYYQKDTGGPNHPFNTTMNIFASPNVSYLSFGLEALELILSKNVLEGEYIAEISSCLEPLLQNDMLDLVNRAANLTVALAENITKKDLNHLYHLGRAFIQTAIVKINSWDLVPIIDMIETFIENSHLVFKDSLDLLIPYLKSVFQLTEYPDKRKIINILVCISTKFPSFYKSNNSCFLIMLEVIFLEMIKISEVPSENWLNPQPNSEYDHKEDPNQEPILYGMEILDSILDNIDCKALFQVFKEAIKGMNHHPDWRRKYAALMALSQISEYLKSKSDIRDIFDIIFENVKHPHPRIRFACFQAIGQTVDDRREIVFKLFFDRLLLTIVQDGFNDPVPYVSSHAFACFTNFAENCEYRKVKPYIADIITQAERHLAASLPLLVENALSCLHEVFNILDTQINTINYQPLMATIQFLLDSPYKKVRSQSLETLSKLLFEVVRADPTLLSNYFVTVEKMNHVCMQTIQVNPELVDREYVLATLRRVISITKGALPTVDQIKSILIFVKEVLASLDGQEDDHSKICIDLTSDIFEDTKIFSAEFFEICDGFMVDCLNTLADDSLKLRIVSLYNCLAKKVVISSPVTAASQLVVGAYLAKLLEVFPQPSPDTDDKQDSYHEKLSNGTIILAVRQFIVDCNVYINAEWLHAIITAVRAYTVLAVQGHADMFEFLEAETEDEEARNGYELILKGYEDAIEEATALAENLYKYFKNNVEVQGLLTFFTSQICHKCMESPREEMIKVGLCIIDDAIDYFSYNEIKNIWQPCLEVYLKHSTSEIHSIRQAGCFGLGIWIKKSPLDQVQIAYNSIKNTLVNCLNYAPDEDNQNQYFYAQDNVAAAIGHLIAADDKNLQAGELLDYWLDYLPLKRDKTEAREQHLKLVRWFNLDNVLFSPGNPVGLHRLSKILKIFAEVYHTKRLSDEEVKSGIRLHIASLQKHPLVHKHSDDIWGGLAEEDRARLLEIQMSSLTI